MMGIPDDLETLYTRLIDARAGHDEGVTLADRPEIVDLFTGLRDLHDRHARALAPLLARHGIDVEDDESLLALVHKTVLRVRALVTGLDENLLAGIIDGEERIADLYDDVLSDLPGDDPLHALLSQQRAELGVRIAALEARAAQDSRRNNPA
jgi:hypothetical protein